jgi:hypothetical protein
LEPEKAEKTARKTGLAQTARTASAVATKTTQKRQSAAKQVSGRELVANAGKRQGALEDASGWATSGASSKTSATGWGKTRPVSVAANEQNASAKAPVAPVGYLNAPRKTEADVQLLTESCDRFFGWEAGDEALLNAISEPTGGVGETLTAYSTAPSPTEPAFPTAVGVAPANGQDATTLAEPLQDGATATELLAASEPTAGLGEIAKETQVSESASTPSTAPVLTAYSPSGTRKNASDRADLASQLGETGFDWFNSKAQNVESQPATAAAPVETTAAPSESEIAPSAPVETAENALAETPRVDLEAAMANRLALVSVEGFEEPAPVAEVGELASSFPVEPAPTAEGLTPVAVETLEVEAPQALVAVEEVVGTENNVAGPNFALAAPGLGAGEAIQNAADERKEAAVAKPLSGDEIAWVGQIKSAIQTLVAERDAKKAAGEDVRRLDARLRLLYLAVDEYDRSIQEIQDDADPLKVFWETERGDLETLLQSRLEEIDPTFVAERLRAGLDSLSGLCDLQIRKSALVVAPACFGLYEERAEAFQPGETVFAYAELEYVSCRETDEGRLIDVECRWRLLNADGSELTPVETQRCSNLSETKLRDVVLNVSAPLPKDLAPGTYLLETEVVDMNRPGAKPATRRLELTVVAGENAEKTAE